MSLDRRRLFRVWSLIHSELQNGSLLINTDSKNENDIASFNYQAKACGISRKDTIKSAKEKCPLLKVLKVTMCLIALVKRLNSPLQKWLSNG